MTTNGTIKAALQCRGIPPSMALWYLMGLPAAAPVYYDLHAVATAQGRWPFPLLHSGNTVKQQPVQGE